MYNIKLNFIDLKFENCKNAMIEHLLNNDITPNKIYYYSDKYTNLYSQSFYIKITKDDLFKKYHENSIVLVDLINGQYHKNIINKLKHIDNLVIFSNFSVFIKDIDLYYVYSNPLFNHKPFQHRNKTMELELIKKFNKTYKTTFKNKSTNIHNNNFNKTEFFIENPIEYKIDNNQDDELFELTFF
jgi:hypothetical protein